MMAPLGYMAKGEGPDSTGTSLGLVFAEISFLVLASLWYFDAYFDTLRVTFLCLVLAFSIFTTFLALVSMTPRYNYEDEH